MARKALPIATETPKDALDFAAWQIQLERRHFSSGTIDGLFGMRSKRAVYQFQRHMELPITHELDIETRLQLGKPHNPFTDYTITNEDLLLVQPTPKLWREKAQASFLGYNTTWEMLSEKFHTTERFLKKLNPTVNMLSEGSSITVPNLKPDLPLPKVSRIEIILNQTTLLAYDANGRVVCCFPCSIARNKNKRPNGRLEVINFALNPNYTFNPETLTTIAEQEGITSKMIIPPGPNNPVGLAWIGLSLPGYGIHGTPDPRSISRTGSSGCFRLANWNAKKLLHMISRGVPVSVIE
ncbi:MAG: L,D-transpeptidase [Verrucomicrobiota bacterium]